MKANELADELEKRHLLGGYASEAATMLRQQQAEIEALKQIIDANNLNQNIGQFVKPTNEPVAWTDGNGNYFDKNSFFPVDDLIPLYTHPAKDLEDIDINITWNENSMRDFGKDELNFARAILRKASEK